MQDRARGAAVDTYSEIHHSLLEDAQKAEAMGFPSTARDVRRKASLVARAALAEELDPEPRR